MGGQPEFDRKLDAPNLRQLKQRIVLRYKLKPISLEEPAEYIDSRLVKVGLSEQTVFPDDLITEIHIRSRGIPRVMNGIFDNLMLTAFAMESKVCTQKCDSNGPDCVYAPFVAFTKIPSRPLLCAITATRAIPALMEAFWKPELPAPYWADCKLRLSQLRAPSMHALVVDLAEALSPFLSPDIPPDLFRRRGFALC